jgi:thioredoxin-like negative regulator of GroEL
VLGVIVVRAWTRRRLQSVASAPPVLWGLLGAHPNGRPTVVAFSTPSCKECGLQSRILAGLSPLRVINVDAAARPDVAHAFGVLTAPSTAVLGGDGSLVAVNHGLALSEKLREQLDDAELDPARTLIGA